MLGRAVVARLECMPGTDCIVAPSREELNLLDWQATADFVAEGGFDAIVHCAARVGSIQDHSDHQFAFSMENLRIGMNVIDAANNAGVGSLVNIGTAAWYGGEDDACMGESEIAAGLVNPDNEAYAWAKYMCLKLCQYSNFTGNAYKTIIPCNLYGPGDNFSDSRGHLVAAAITKINRAVCEAVDSVEIWGDGSARREFMYVKDLAELVVWCLERMSSLPDYFNAGAVDSHTVLEVYQHVARELGFSGEFAFDLTRPVGSKNRVMDSHLLSSHGWQAHTSLADGIKETVKFYRAQYES
jgi:GDP-L-fucose synthase